jgi:hypothetical protein
MWTIGSGVSPERSLHQKSQYINQKDDLITLVPKSKTPLRRFLERFQCFRLSPLFRIQPVSGLPLDFS